MVQAELAGSPHVDVEAGQLLVGVAARLTRLHSKVLTELEVPLTFRQHRTLVRVRGGVTSLTELASYGNLAIPTVSEGVEVLVRRRLLNRVPSPADRRAIKLQITPAGAEAADAGDEALQQVADVLIGNVSPEGRALLTETLESIYDAATTYFKKPGDSD